MTIFFSCDFLHLAIQRKYTCQQPTEAPMAKRSKFNIACDYLLFPIKFCTIHSVWSLILNTTSAFLAEQRAFQCKCGANEVYTEWLPLLQKRTPCQGHTQKLAGFTYAQCLFLYTLGTERMVISCSSVFNSRRTFKQIGMFMQFLRGSK